MEEKKANPGWKKFKLINSDTVSWEKIVDVEQLSNSKYRVLTSDERVDDIKTPCTVDSPSGSNINALPEDIPFNDNIFTPYLPMSVSDVSVDMERVNFTAIAYIAQMESSDAKAHTQMREGFEMFIEHYKRDETPYTLDDNGNYWVWPDVALFILDHVTPTFKMVALKRRIFNGEEFKDLEEHAARLLGRYIVTGVSDDNNRNTVSNGMIRDSKKMIELAMQLGTVIRQIFSIRP